VQIAPVSTRFPLQSGNFAANFAILNHCGIGSQVQRPLATVVVGGMLIGPIMLPVVIPALRMMFLGNEGDDPAAASKGDSRELAPAD
jgi:hypothetical protein